MKKSLKFTALILIICMLLPMLFACDVGNDKDRDKNKNETQENTVESSIPSEDTSDSTEPSEEASETDGEPVEQPEDSQSETEFETQPEETYEYMYFGSYPQAEVEDGELIESLNTSFSQNLPSENQEENDGWVSYRYYNKYEVCHYMWYKDVEYGGENYRGVYFANYRPVWNYYNHNHSNQEDNGYIKENVYWFKYEPIKWRVLEKGDGKAFLLCESIIDSREFYRNEQSRTTDTEQIFPNNYEHSDIRFWLNNTFYNAAFSEIEKSKIIRTLVDNSITSTGDTENGYICGDTNDYVFLPSVSELPEGENKILFDDEEYNPSKQKSPTDYALCQGTAMPEASVDPYFQETGYWLLRSPAPDGACVIVDNRGQISKAFHDVDITDYGICPALWVEI